MIENLPTYIPLVFILTAVASLLLFCLVVKASDEDSVRKKAGLVAFGLTGWLLIQAVLSIKNVYNSNTNSIPPKILLLGILPSMLTIILLFTTTKGREFTDSLPLKNITYINVVRIPVELVLLWLFINKAVPQLMTFEGRNFDILSGISAPFIAYFGFAKRKLSRQIILLWNFVCLALLVNIVVIALLSAPFPSQKFGFGQPNIAILNLPFSWLPTFIVPVVLYGHLASIRRLIKSKPMLYKSDGREV